MAAEFEVYKDNRGEFRWRLKSGNAVLIADSGEGYKTKNGVMNGIEAVRRDAPGAGIDDQT